MRSISLAGDSTPKMGCCSVQRDRLTTQHLDVNAVTMWQGSEMLGESAFARDTFSAKKSTKTMEGSMKSTWQTWLDQWEERQRLNLQQYEQSTKTLVDDLRRDLFEKLGEMERQQNVVNNRRSQAKGGLAPPTPMVPLASEDGEHIEALGSAQTRQASETATPRSPHGPHAWRPMKSVANMNHAMTEVVGAAKYARQCTKSTQHTSTTNKSPLSDGGLVLMYQTTDSEVYMPKNDYQRCLFGYVHHPMFTTISGLLITAYAVTVGIIADLEMRAAVAGNGPPEWRAYVDIVFTIICVIEFLFRLVAEGRYFFKGTDKWWNLFDMTVAAVGLADIALSDVMNLNFLRVLRTVRAMRLLRVIRFLRVFRELRLMMASILCCLIPLTSAFALLVTVIYVFAVALLQGASEYLRAGQGSEVMRSLLITNFGTMGMTIYSLTQAISGGRSWSEFSDPFMEINWGYGIAFAAFVIFVIFGVLNILTGVFVEATTTLANVDKELVIQEQIARSESAVGQMRSLFREIDDNGSGTITRSELMRNLKDERVRAYFSVLQMDVSEAHGLFELLDRDESGEVSIDEFIMTCMRLKGAARSLDLAAMLFENKRLYSSLKTFMASVDDMYTDINNKLGALQHAYS